MEKRFCRIFRNFFYDFSDAFQLFRFFHAFQLFSRENKREYVSSPEARALLTIGREMITELQKLTQKLTDDNEEAEMQDEWVFASIIQKVTRKSRTNSIKSFHL